MVTASPSGRIEVVGIVSWGDQCGKKDSPGSYANVAMFTKFIAATIASGQCGSGLKSRAESDGTTVASVTTGGTAGNTTKQATNTGVSVKPGDTTTASATASTAGGTTANQLPTLGLSLIHI